MGKRDTRTRDRRRALGARGPQCQAHRQRPDRSHRRAPKPRAKAPAKEASPPPPKPAPKPVAKPAPAARGEALNRQTARQLERGKLPVEARLDLHGMRQREAHAALRRFLKCGARAGVIATCWSSPARARPPMRPGHSTSRKSAACSGRPCRIGWPRPTSRHVVLSYSEAPRRLGGEGALYVRLRKRVRPRGRSWSGRQ